MNEEVKAIVKNHTSELVTFSKGHKAIECQLGVQDEEKCQKRDQTA